MYPHLCDIAYLFVVISSLPLAWLETELPSLENSTCEVKLGLCSDWVRRVELSILLKGCLPREASPHGLGSTELPEEMQFRGFGDSFRQKTDRASRNDTDGTISSMLSVARVTVLGEPGLDEGMEVVIGLNTGGLGNLWHTEGQDGGRRTLETGGAVTGRLQEDISPSQNSLLSHLWPILPWGDESPLLCISAIFLLSGDSAALRR